MEIFELLYGLWLLLEGLFNVVLFMVQVLGAIFDAIQFAHHVIQFVGALYKTERPGRFL